MSAPKVITSLTNDRVKAIRALEMRKVRKETGLDNTSFRFHEKDGFGSFYWIDQPLAYALSGRLSRDDLMTLANAVYAQFESQDAGKATGRPVQPQ
mgnify:CR=1 FL=1